MRVLFFVVLALSITACHPKDLPTQVEYREKGMTAKFSHMTTSLELVDVQQEAMDRYNIDVDFSKSTFLDSERLQTLEITIKPVSGSDMRGHLRAELLNLQYYYYGFSFDLYVGLKVGQMD